MSSVAALAILFASQAASSPTPQAKPIPMHGLFIGVSNYPKGVGDLHGTTDAALYRDTLRSLWNFEFKEDHVLQQATKKGILEKLDHLVEVTRGIPADQQLGVVIVFSGHGGVVQDPDTKRFVACLMPADVRGRVDPFGFVPEIDSVVLVKDFRERIDKLRENGVRNITVILDACYSGGMSRSAGTAESRNVVNPEAERPGAVREKIQLANDEFGSPVFVLASQVDQKAYESPDPSGDPTLGKGHMLRAFQLLSRRLKMEVASGEREEMGITISELASALESQIRTFRASGEQIPVVFGPANRRLFDTRVEVTETGFRITRESDRVIYVEAGQALGVRPGYRFAIVPRSARRFTPGQEGAILARVANEKDIEPDRTRIVLDQPLPNASGMKAFIAEVSPDMVLRVDLDSLIGTKYYDLARQVLSPQIQEKQRGRGADVVILPPSPVPVRPGFPHQAKAFGVYSNSGTVDFAEDKKRNGFDSVTRSASLSADLPDGEWVSRLARIFRNASRHKALLAIKPVPDVVVIEAEMVEVELPDGVANPANYRILSGSEEQRKGGIATGIRFFGLKMRSQQRGDLLPGPGFSRFLDVLTVTPDGEVAHLWPRGGAEGDTRQSLPANGEWYYLGQQGKLLPVSGYGGQGKLAIFYQSPNEHGFGEGVLRIFGTKQADIPFASLATNSSDLSRSATTSGSSLGSLISDFGSGGNFTDRSAMRLDGWSLVDLRTQFKK